jgi:hypothetical protein
VTQEELLAQIKQDIAQKGGAHVPIGIIREVFYADTRISVPLAAVLEEFASNHGWHIRHDDDASPTPRVIFYPVESA